MAGRRLEDVKAARGKEEHLLRQQLQNKHLLLLLLLLTEEGNATFYLSGTGTVMRSGSGTGFGPGSNIKSNYKGKKNAEANFLGNNHAFSSEKRKILYKKNFRFKTVLNKSGSGTGAGTAIKHYRAVSQHLWTLLIYLLKLS